MPRARLLRQLQRHALRRGPRGPAFRCSWELWHSARPPARPPQQPGLQAWDDSQLAHRFHFSRAHCGSRAQLRADSLPVSTREIDSSKLVMCSQFPCPFLRADPIDCPALPARALDVIRSRARNQTGTTRILINHQGKRIADNGARAQGSGPVTVRLNRIVQLPERRGIRPIPCTRLCYAEPYTGMS